MSSYSLEGLRRYKHRCETKVGTNNSAVCFRAVSTDLQRVLQSIVIIRVVPSTLLCVIDFCRYNELLLPQYVAALGDCLDLLIIPSKFRHSRPQPFGNLLWRGLSVFLLAWVSLDAFANYPFSLRPHEQRSS